MARKKTIKKRPPTTYNKVLKRFTAYNNTLPEYKKLSIQQRRQIIKQSIIPALYGTAKSRIRNYTIDALIVKQVRKIPKRDPNACNLNYIDPSTYEYIEWFELDTFISKVLPDCIYVKVSAGTFGETKIFNTRNYNYYSLGVNAIVEEIRKEVENSSGDAWFTGFQKLRPKKKNDGKADSYYLDLILFIAGARTSAKAVSPVGESVTYTVKGRKQKAVTKKRKIKVAQRIKKVKKKIAAGKKIKSAAFRNIKATKTEVEKVLRPGFRQTKEMKALSLKRANQLMPRLISKIKDAVQKNKISVPQYKFLMKDVEAIKRKINKSK